MPLLAAAGCTTTTSFFLPEPIPLGLDGGALVSQASVDDSAPFSIVVDTGSPVTVWDDGLGSTAVETGRFRLFDIFGVPRLELDDLRLYSSPLRRLGLGAGFPVGGVFGGDNLQRWVLGLDYRGAAPTLTLFYNLTPCNCELSRACQAVVPFTLAGGGQDRPLSIGNQVVTYPATRILVDVCLEPYSDPVPNVRCASDIAGDILSPAYLSSGVDARLIVSTGFPGFALSASIFDRLHGSDSAAEALAAPRFLHLPDQADDDGTVSPPPTPAPGLAVGVSTLGRDGTAALAIIERQGYLGPCAELARSRRQRRSPPDHPRPGEAGCFLDDVCNNSTDNQACDDQRSKDHISAVLEIGESLPTYVMPDTAPILVGINADARPGSATVDGIIGTEVLKRFVSSIDYPRHRLVAQCVSAKGCITYPAFVNADVIHNTGCDDHSLCIKPSEIPDAGPGCPPAP